MNTYMDIKETLYNYQGHSVNFGLANLPNKNVLLAAAPNAGKTYMSTAVMEELLHQGKRVLCSVHGTNVLKHQFYKSVISIIDKSLVSIYDTSNKYLFDPSKPIQVMIYQNEKQIAQCVSEYGKFDNLIVDEAHKFYNTQSMTKISDEYVSGNHLLLTGSPSIFKHDVDNGIIAATYIAVSTIQEEVPNQYDTKIVTNIVTNNIMLGLVDFNGDGEVLESSEYKLNEVNNDVLLDTLLVGDFGKTIIFVKSIKQSRNVGGYLDNKGLSVLVSNSADDKTSDNIDIFKELEGNHTLIVVGRCREGFDDPNVSIIDMTYSKNIDTLHQMYCRAIRKSTLDGNKRYIKVVPNDLQSAKLYTNIMTGVLMLLKQENFETFNGKNFSLTTIKQEIKIGPKGEVKTYLPKPEIITDDIHDSVVTKCSDEPRTIEDLISDDGFVITIKHNGNEYYVNEGEFEGWEEKLEGETYTVKIKKLKINIDNELLIQTSLKSGVFFDVMDEQYDLIHNYARSQLSDVLADISGTLVVYATAEEHVKFIKEYNLTTIKKYIKSYKGSTLNLHSKPWNKYGNGSAKDYFESIWGEYATAEEHVKFIKEYNLTSNKVYSDSYKSSNFKLSSYPWIKYGNGSVKDYFENIWGEYATAEEHVKFIKEYNLTSSKKYSDSYKSSTLNLHSKPWNKYGNGSAKDYFESIFGAKEEYATAEEHVKFIKEYNLTSSKKYIKSYKGRNFKLSSHPWSKYGNGSVKDYFEDIFGAKEEYATAEEHLKFIKEYNLTSSKKYGKSYKGSTLNLYSHPWIKYGNGSMKDYFEDIFGYQRRKEKTD